MRMEELSDSQFIKGTDTVERYLLGLVQTYFKDSNVAEPASREFIIRRAVARMKEEFRYENIGVLSVTLADGVARTGPVNITLADLAAEPAITPKLSAFNVNFGDQANTACEGNDPRLSDSRDPNPHVHTIQDINGLEGRLSTLLSILNRVSGYTHTHENLNVLNKLVYSGSMPTIDLNFIDTLESDVNQKITALRDEMDRVINTEIPTELEKIKNALDNVEVSIQKAEAVTGATHRQYLQQANDYTDSKVLDALTQFDGCFDGYVTKEQMNETSIGVLSYIGCMHCDMSRLKNPAQKPEENDYATYVYKPAITDSILEELAERNTTLEECLIDILVYKDTEDGHEYSKMPYYNMSSSGEITGALLSGIDYENKSILFSYKMSTPLLATTPPRRSTLPSAIRKLAIEIRFYAKRKVTV